MLKYIQKMRWADMKKEFAKIGVPIVEPGDDWKAIMEIKKVRDCIAHSGGRTDKGMVQKLKSYNFDGMRLPDGYFGRVTPPLCGRDI